MISGKAIGEELLKENYNVAILDVDEESGNKTIAEWEEHHGKESSLFLKCDVTNDEQFQEAFDKVHILS